MRQAPKLWTVAATIALSCAALLPAVVRGAAAVCGVVSMQLPSHPPSYIPAVSAASDVACWSGGDWSTGDVECAALLSGGRRILRYQERTRSIAALAVSGRFTCAIDDEQEATCWRTFPGNERTVGVSFDDDQRDIVEYEAEGCCESVNCMSIAGMDVHVRDGVVLRADWESAEHGLWWIRPLARCVAQAVVGKSTTRPDGKFHLVMSGDDAPRRVTYVASHVRSMALSETKVCLVYEDRRLGCFDVAGPRRINLWRGADLPPELHDVTAVFFVGEQVCVQQYVARSTSPPRTAERKPAHPQRTLPSRRVALAEDRPHATG